MFPTPQDYGAAADGVTDDTAAIQALLDDGAGIKHFPQAIYLISAPLIVSNVGTTLIGDGCGDMVTPYGAGPAGPTTIRASHCAGPAIRFQVSNCGVHDMRIDATGARSTAALDPLSSGIRLEATDTGVGLERTMMTQIRNVHCTGHPGDGFLFVADCTGSSIHYSQAAGNKGHGLCIDGGFRTGRTNIARPGILDILSCRSQRNGGHAIAIGSPNTDTNVYGLPYRVRLINFECFGNCDDVAARYGLQAAWLYGENFTITGCALGGLDAAGTPDVYQGIYLAGRHHRVINNRFVSVTRAMTIGQRSPTTSRDIIIDGAYFANGGGTVMSPAVNVTSGADMIKVRAAPSPYYTSLASIAVGVSIEIDGERQINGDRILFRNGATTVLDVDAPGNALGFFGNAAVAKPSVTGSRGGNAALASLLTALDNLGIVTNNSTA